MSDDISWAPEAFVRDGVVDTAALRASYDDLTAKAAAAPSEPDYSWVPENFMSDGKPDTAGLRARYDELATFKAQADERESGLPLPAQYEIRVPEGLQMPEGVAIPKDADGNPLSLELDPLDPEIGLLRQTAHDLKIDQAGMDKLLSIWAIKEVRAMQDDIQYAQAEDQKLGPDAASRKETIKRGLASRLDEPLAKAVEDSIQSADALRGIEKLLGSPAPGQSTTIPNAPDLSKMSPLEKLNYAAEQRKSA